MIVADPLETDITTPEEDTVATFRFDDNHVTGASVIVAPPASLTVALSVAVDPIDSNASELGDNSTVEGT